MRLWIPGPTQVRAELAAECARPMIGHRSSDMTRLIERLDPHLRLAFGLSSHSDAQVGVHSCSATGLMEAALLGCGPRVLSLASGAFGRRFHEIAQLCGKEAEVLEAPWGEVVPAQALERALEERAPFDALTVVASETSTGVRAPLDDYARALRSHPGTLLLVDVVSWIAGEAVDFDARGLDFCFAGTQKALALPPGISVLCASRGYLEQARAQTRRGFYLDPLRILEGHVQRKTPATPCIPLYYALARQLEDISAGLLEGGGTGAEAWQARFQRHARMRARVESWAAQHELEYLPAPPLRSPTVSCIRAGRIEVPAFLSELKRRGHQVGNGYQQLKDRTFRIGHMGDHTEADLAELLSAADEVLSY